MNAGLEKVDRSLLIGESVDVALQTLLESDKSPRLELRFDRVYPHIHFIPMDQNGVRLLRVLTRPDWENQILSAAFPPEWRVTGPKAIEHDAQRDDTLIFSHLDSDIARLVRLRQALEYHTDPVEILCFPWQTDFLRGYLGNRARLCEIGMDALEEALDFEEI